MGPSTQGNQSHRGMWLSRKLYCLPTPTFCIPTTKHQRQLSLRREVCLAHIPGGSKAWCLCGLSSDEDFMAQGSWWSLRRARSQRAPRKWSEPDEAGLTSFNLLAECKESQENFLLRVPHNNPRVGHQLLPHPKMSTTPH